MAKPIPMTVQWALDIVRRLASLPRGDVDAAARTLAAEVLRLQAFEHAGFDPEAPVYGEDYVRRLQAENAALREIALMAESLRARLCIEGLHEKPEIELEHEQLTTALQDAYESGAFPEWIRK